MRIGVAGIGVVSPIGVTSREFYENLIHGTHNMQNETETFSGLGEGHMSSRVSLTDKEKIKKNIIEASKFSLVELYALHAIQEALLDANIDIVGLKSKRVLLVLGNNDLEAYSFDSIVNENEKRHTISSYGIINAIKQYFNIQDITAYCIHTACASAITSMDIAYKYMKDDKYDLSIIGGVDAFSKINYCGFSSMRAISHSFSGPFTAQRDGITIGEGAGILILQKLEKIKNPYCEVLGTGISCDADHLTRCSEEGLKRAIAQLLKVYKIENDCIDLVIAHGTGTALNDENESNIIKQMYKNGVKVCSIKGITGHLMGAAGGVSSVLAALILRYEIIPSDNFGRGIDPKCDINLIEKVQKHSDIKTIICHSLGFGGNNAVIAFRKLKDKIENE